MVVTPFVGVWIEIAPMDRLAQLQAVTPFVGVWIEIRRTMFNVAACYVTPFVGVWIEIRDDGYSRDGRMPSLPLWECGLKLIMTL